MEITFDPTNEKERNLVLGILTGAPQKQSAANPKTGKTPDTKSKSEPKPKPEPKSETQSDYSLRQIQILVKDYVGRDKEKKQEVKALLNELDATSVSSLAEANYGTFVEELEKLSA